MSAGVMLFNPFTGAPRHPSDIASDPAGILVWDGEEPLRAAAASPLTDDEIVAWVDGFILKKAYNYPVAVQIALEAAKFVRSTTASRERNLSERLTQALRELNELKGHSKAQQP